MSNLFSKNEDLESSPVIIGFNLLKIIEKNKTDKISIFDIAYKFRNEKWFSPKNLYFALLFLYSVDLIDLRQAYIIKNVKN